MILNRADRQIAPVLVPDPTLVHLVLNSSLYNKATLIIFGTHLTLMIIVRWNVTISTVSGMQLDYIFSQQVNLMNFTIVVVWTSVDHVYGGLSMLRQWVD